MAYFGNGISGAQPQGNYSNLGASAGTSAIWGTIVFTSIVAMVAVPTIVDTLIKTKILGFDNKLSTKAQVGRSAAVGAAIALPIAALYGGITYTVVREA